MAFIKSFQEFPRAASAASSDSHLAGVVQKHRNQLPSPSALCTKELRSPHSTAWNSAQFIGLPWLVSERCPELSGADSAAVVNVVTLPHCLCGTLGPSINKTWWLSARINSVHMANSHTSLQLKISAQLPIDRVLPALPNQYWEAEWDYGRRHRAPQTPAPSWVCSVPSLAWSLMKVMHNQRQNGLSCCWQLGWLFPDCSAML